MKPSRRPLNVLMMAALLGAGCACAAPNMPSKNDVQDHNCRITGLNEVHGVCTARQAFEQRLQKGSALFTIVGYGNEDWLLATDEVRVVTPEASADPSQH